MLERFKRLLEIAKNDEELKKELTSSLDKIESDKNLNFYEIKIFDEDEVKEVAESIFSKSVFERLVRDGVRLLDNKLSFCFRVNGGDISFRYSLKNYRLLGYEFILSNDLKLNENEVKRRKQICDETKQRISSFDTYKNKIICHTVIRKMQENYLKEEKTILFKNDVDRIKDRLDVLGNYISDIPNISVSDVEYECSTAMRILRDTQEILENY
ncbi:hypothetical protein [Campylobacter canadensis]|uniref:hypothetical protein n=1 Tax=Campylobacter canadensis TaxID=449520 RepID=UPI001CCBA02F|nr:hypothetical protein [Campylobacter canadensis]MBZ8002654.1 hypothetical protein [Campylobacter canadensis]